MQKISYFCDRCGKEMEKIPDEHIFVDEGIGTWRKDYCRNCFNKVIDRLRELLEEKEEKNNEQNS